MIYGSVSTKKERVVGNDHEALSYSDENAPSEEEVHVAIAPPVAIFDMLGGALYMTVCVPETVSVAVRASVPFCNVNVLT